MNENLPATFDQLSSQLQPLVSNDHRVLKRLLSTETADPALQPFGNAMETHFSHIMSTNAIWLNLKAPGNTLQTKFTPAQWHEFVSPILYLHLFHMLKDPESPLLELGTTQCSLPLEIPSGITSPFHLLMSGSGWPWVIKDLHDNFTPDAAHFPASDQELSDQPAILSILNRSGHLLHKSKLDIIQLNLNFAALHMSHLTQMGILDYPKSWDAFVVQLKKFFSGSNSSPLNLPTHLERDYKRMEWLFPLLIALAITPLILLHPTALYTTSANRDTLLRIALALGPTSERPSSLQAVEKMIWTKLIEMANGTKTSLDLIKELLDKIPDVENFMSTISERDAQFFFPDISTSAPISSSTQIEMVEEATSSQSSQPLSVSKDLPPPTMAQTSHDILPHDDPPITPIDVDITPGLPADTSCASSPGASPVGIMEDTSPAMPSEPHTPNVPIVDPTPMVAMSLGGALVSPTTATESTDVDATPGLPVDKTYRSSPGMSDVPIMDEIFPHAPPEDDTLSVRALIMRSFVSSCPTPADIDITSGLLSGSGFMLSPEISPAPLINDISPNAPLADDSLSVQAPSMSPTPAVTTNLGGALFLPAATTPTNMDVTPDLITGIDYMSSPQMSLMEEISSHLPFGDSPLSVQAQVMSSPPVGMVDVDRDLSLSPITTISSVDTTLDAAGYINTHASSSNPVTDQNIPSLSAPKDLAQGTVSKLFDCKGKHPAVVYQGELIHATLPLFNVSFNFPHILEHATTTTGSINTSANLFSSFTTQDTLSQTAPKDIAQTITESFNQVEDCSNDETTLQLISKRKRRLSDEGEHVTIPPEVRCSTRLSTKAASADMAILSRTQPQKQPQQHTNCTSTKVRHHVSPVKPDFEPQIIQPK
ncbi:hypothetical protein GYMLUDRAFT_62295 [Collybiopsis luxurians FD-317 M1]|uniref:Uncharacterized protein n=1 Tax=Collybiopsis luxurians FD-317 M1 TaxID=944289 RepID=A0A0D0CLM6_9AGAR|nr:hypothetical protein GYMLUDRAFT_62295 [Collybiopsis luxurians FD-317 M1]